MPLARDLRADALIKVQLRPERRVPSQEHLQLQSEAAARSGLATLPPLLLAILLAAVLEALTSPAGMLP